MLKCFKADKIGCRLDLFDAQSWEYSQVADLSLCQRHLWCLLSLPVPSDAWLGLDTWLDYFISPPVTSCKSYNFFFNGPLLLNWSITISKMSFNGIISLCSRSSPCADSAEALLALSIRSFSSPFGTSTHTGNVSSSCQTLRSPACFGKMDGDSFGFIIMPDLFIAWLRRACWSTVALCGSWRLRHWWNIPVSGGYSLRRALACLREGRGWQYKNHGQGYWNLIPPLLSAWVQRWKAFPYQTLHSGCRSWAV